MKTFKCVLVGDAGVGKTTFVHEHLTGNFLQVYDPTLGVEVHPIVFNTSIGPIRFNVWDTAGQKKYSGLGDDYFVQADCAIVMFDLTNDSSLSNSKIWFNRIIRKCGDIPVILVANKSDIGSYDVTRHDISSSHSLDLFSIISSKLSLNCVDPFIKLAQSLLHNTSISSS
jgi:GTP-binding nuclear protein Ran